MKKIITLGSAIQDIFLSVHDRDVWHKTINKHDYWLIEEGSKIEVSSLHVATGGGATNAAASLALLGHQVLPICKIANDAAGTFILNDLKQRNISTEYIARSSHGSSGTSCIAMAEGCNRILFTHRGANQELTEQDIPWDLIATECEGLYMTALAGTAAKLFERIITHAADAKVQIALNPGKGQLTDDYELLMHLLPHISLFMLNEEEAELLFSQINTEVPFSYDAYFDAILSRGNTIAVVTCGAQGVHVATNKERFFHKAYQPKKITNTVGAGDGFGSCLFGLLLKDYPLKRAVEYAVINSTSVLQGRDAKEGLLSLEQLTQSAKN